MDNVTVEFKTAGSSYNSTMVHTETQWFQVEIKDKYPCEHHWSGYSSPTWSTVTTSSQNYTKDHLLDYPNVYVYPLGANMTISWTGEQ